MDKLKEAIEASHGLSEDVGFFVMRPEVLNSATGKLALQIAKALSPDPSVQSAFLPIIIGLLPVLADLLLANCNPTPERLARQLQVANKRPLLRRRCVNRINDWARKSEGASVYRELHGEHFGVAAIAVLGDPENNDIVIEAFIEDAPVKIPVWGTFSQ